MAETFKSYATGLTGSSITTLYTVPSATTIVGKSLYCANVNPTLAATIDVCILKSGSSTNTYLISGASIPVASTLQVISESVALESSDVLKVRASTGNYLDCTFTYLQIT